jgi:hypothetical protein
MTFCSLEMKAHWQWPFVAEDIRTIGHATALLVVLKKASMSGLMCSVGAYATFLFSALGCALACFDLMRAAEDAPSSDSP